MKQLNGVKQAAISKNERTPPSLQFFHNHAPVGTFRLYCFCILDNFRQQLKLKLKLKQ